MLICHIVDRLDGIGGVQTYLTDLLPALGRVGIDSIVITEQSVTRALPDVKVHVVPGLQQDGTSLPASVTAALLKTFKRVPPDACIVHVAPSPGVLAACASVAPTLVFAHDYFMACPGNGRYLAKSRRFCQEGPGARCFVRAYTEQTASRSPRRLFTAHARQRAWRDAWKCAARVLVASPFVADVLAAHGVAREQIGVLPYFVASPPRQSTARRDIDILFVGRLVSMKGVDVLVDALAQLPGRRASIAGSGPEETPIAKRVRQHKLEDRVVLHGAISAAERYALLARARVFALPSLWAEPFGIAGVEALAAGLPVVASLVGGVDSWLPASHAELAVAPGDPCALAHSLNVALTHSDYASLVKDALEAASRFTLDRHLTDLRSELLTAGVG